MFEKNLSSEEVIFNLNYIDINLDQRKWVKNFINILTTDYIQEVSKKWFRGKIKIHSNFGTCSTDAKIKVSGRGLDHINSNKMVSSLDVRLTKETIGHIKNFKLFLSGTRGSKEIKISERDDLEILLSAILRKLGVLSPITRKIEFSLNGNNVHEYFKKNQLRNF